MTRQYRIKNAIPGYAGATVTERDTDANGEPVPNGDGLIYVDDPDGGVYSYAPEDLIPVCTTCGETYRESDHTIADVNPGLCPSCAVGG